MQKMSKFVKNEHAWYTAVYISLGCALYIRCALSVEKYGNFTFVNMPHRIYKCTKTLYDYKKGKGLPQQAFEMAQGGPSRLRSRIS